MPRLSVINVEQNGELVECQMEIKNGASSVSFKFNRDNDNAEDIADNLVSDIIVWEHMMPYYYIYELAIYGSP